MGIWAYAFFAYSSHGTFQRFCKNIDQSSFDEKYFIHSWEIHYTFNFDNNTITSNIPQFWKNYDPFPVVLSLQWLNTSNIKEIRWQYVFAKDPQRTIETSTIPWFAQDKFFFLPIYPWEYLFSAKIIYYNWTIIDTANIFSWPILTIWPDEARPDIPMVVLKVDKNQTTIWEPVTFDVISTTLSNRPDYEQNISIQYDFDGDTIWDLTTWSSHITHIYTGVSEYGYRPKVAVTHRGYKWIANWEVIIVGSNNASPENETKK